MSALQTIMLILNSRGLLESGRDCNHASSYDLARRSHSEALVGLTGSSSPSGMNRSDAEFMQ